MASGRSRASRARLFTTAKPRVLTRPNLVWLRKREHCRSMWDWLYWLQIVFSQRKKHPACTNGATFPSIHLSIISLSFSFLASTIDTKLWLHNFSQYFLQNAGSSSCSCVKMWKTWSKNRGRWEQLTPSVGYPPQVEICRLQLHESKKSKKHTEATHTTCTRKLNNFCQSNKLHGTANFHLQSAQSKVALFRRQSCKFGSTSKRVDFEQLQESGCRLTRLTQHWAAIHSCAHLKIASRLDFESYRIIRLLHV